MGWGREVEGGERGVQSGNGDGRGGKWLMKRGLREEIKRIQ